jgi:DNA-binding NarL/FixJ family response regulator
MAQRDAAMSPRCLRVLVADVHDIVRTGVRAVVQAQPGWEMCGETAFGQCALDLAQEARPQVVVMGLSLLGMSGIVAARKLREVSDAEVLFLSMFDDAASVSSALAAGARGYVLKSDGLDKLVSAVAAAAAHRTYFSPAIARSLLAMPPAGADDAGLGRLTAREMEVAQLIADGLSNKEIARRLDIAAKTVESHRAAAMRKAGVQTGAQLVRFAIKHHLVAA